jgi:putative phosphoribosyl transferase
MKTFADRKDAGRRLGAELAKLLGEEKVVVLGLPRGGVPVAYEVARILHCPLDVLVVRKIGVPSQPEVAMGAIGENGALVVEHGTVTMAGVSEPQFQLAVARERSELERRVDIYRRGRPSLKLEDEVVVIVDDGLATGATAHVACDVARARGATRIIVAAPVTSNAAANRLDVIADQFVTLERAGGPFAVGQWFEDFDPTSDQEVIDDLTKAALADIPSAAPKSTRPRES